jgi:NTP pyrophosphatase (non-canonical NTP hydrolase)
VSSKTIKQWQQEVHKLAVEKGWYSDDVPNRTPLEMHMLIVSEVAEATEAVRNGEPSVCYEESGKPAGELIELADAVIRILDYCQSRGFDLEQAIEIKHSFNKTRPHRHGGKRL